MPTPALGSTLPTCPTGNWHCYRRSSARLGRKADRSPTHTAYVMDVWSCTSTPPTSSWALPPTFITNAKTTLLASRTLLSGQYANDYRIIRKHDEQWVRFGSIWRASVRGPPGKAPYLAVSMTALDCKGRKQRNEDSQSLVYSKYLWKQVISQNVLAYS